MDRTPKRKRAAIIFFLLAAFLVAGKIFLATAYVPVILMYHSVGDEAATLDGYGSKLNVKTEIFEKQMKFLHENGYRVVPLIDFVSLVKRGERIPHRTIAITFDDGLKNNFTNAFPALKKYNFPATIFVATDFIGKKGFIDWNDIAIMEKNNVSVESHTMSHNWLASMADDAVRKELAGSKEILEKRTGRRIELLSYPLGGYNEEVKRIARETGYLGAVATNPGKKEPNNDPYALKRIRISMSAANNFIFWVETSGYYTFIKEMRDTD